MVKLLGIMEWFTAWLRRMRDGRHRRGEPYGLARTFSGFDLSTKLSPDGRGRRQLWRSIHPG